QHQVGPPFAALFAEFAGRQHPGAIRRPSTQPVDPFAEEAPHAQPDTDGVSRHRTDAAFDGNSHTGDGADAVPISILTCRFDRDPENESRVVRDGFAKDPGREVEGVPVGFGHEVRVLQRAELWTLKTRYTLWRLRSWADTP